MPYEFADDEYELEPQPSSAHSGGPPRKSTGIGMLDEPFPPEGPVGPLRRLSAVVWMRILAILLLAGIAFSVLYPFFASHK
jgi:hypothetical protein